MTTKAQIAANRNNAQHSTGPRTEEGKAASSQNSLKFGFCGSFKVLSLESQEEFDEFLKSLQDEHQPATTTESLLVQKMAEHYWLSRRAQHLQSMSLGHDIPYEQQCREFALYLRYQTTHDRAFHKSLDQLLKLQKERRKAEIGFVPQERRELEKASRQADDATPQSARPAIHKEANQHFEASGPAPIGVPKTKSHDLTPAASADPRSDASKRAA